MKIGDPKHKKEISKSFRELEKLGFKVWNFSTNKQLNIGMRNFTDYIVLGKYCLHFIELKITGDRFSEGQLDTQRRLKKLGYPNFYWIIDEMNYRDVIDTIINFEKGKVN